MTPWTKSQRNVVVAAYLGWTLDAFDFFLMVFMFKDISAELHSSMQVVSTAVLLTLGMRPVGALLFGRLADRFGRKPALIWNILAYSILEMASGFAPSMATLLIVRALFGVAMGGEWGIGSALTMESIPPAARGFVSGLLQVGYPSGYLLASLAVYLFYDRLGWRYMFVLGVIPAVLVFFIRRGVDESPAWKQHASRSAHGDPQRSEARLEAGGVRGHPHDGFQFLQPRVARCVSEPVFEGPASLRYAIGVTHDGSREYRGDLRRHFLRFPVRESSGGAGPS